MHLETLCEVMVGGGLYKIASTQAAGPGKIQSADGQYWELMFQTNYIGSISKAGGITAADLPAGMAAVVKDTSSGNVYLAYNDAGAIATATLTPGTIHRLEPAREDRRALRPVRAPGHQTHAGCAADRINRYGRRRRHRDRLDKSHSP
jgi:hypothetical protein